MTKNILMYWILSKLILVQQYEILALDNVS